MKINQSRKEKLINTLQRTVNNLENGTYIKPEYIKLAKENLRKAKELY